MRSILIIGFLALAIFSGTLLLDGCRKPRQSARATPFAFEIPAGFPQPAYDFAGNPLTVEGIELGRRLFYDGRLSLDGNFPCASCHQPNAAFTTFDHDRSHGFNHSHTLRNAPGLANLAWYSAYFHDGQYTDLESLISRHITHPNEMGETMAGVETKLSTDTMYQRLFDAAYNDPRVTGGRIVDALKQFVLSMVSSNSKWDRVQRGIESFAADEAAGQALFQAKCSSCHTGALFTDFSYRNVGLPINTSLNDLGRMRITGNHNDSLKFRVPSLRNLSLTSYYAHDGRFSAFRLMLRHYQSGVQASSTLDPLLASGIAMSSTEEDQLVRFLFTLTDTGYIHNPRYLP
jgi:cytochrome c peroxidase